MSNPSELLLTEDHDGLSGVAISAAIEGVRPFLVETQALGEHGGLRNSASVRQRVLTSAD